MEKFAKTELSQEAAGMQQSENSPQKTPIRGQIATDIVGLDTILDGGLLKRSTYVVVGASGTGKTVLTQEIAYNCAKRGHNVVCLTFLSESHEKMITNLSSFSFFDQQLIGTNINYFSLYHEISNEGLGGLVAASREHVRKYKSDLVVIDGVSALRDFANSSKELRKELFDLNVQLSVLGCTVLMIVDDKLPPGETPEYAVADGILWMQYETFGRRHVRSLEVLKARGLPVLTGLHYFDITQDGIVLYPRTEATLASQELNAPPALQLNQRYSFGIQGLDQMLSGGLLGNSVNLILGTPGAGKTLTGLHFLYEGASRQERTLLLSFNYSIEHLKSVTSQLGFDISKFLEDGTLRAMWTLPLKRHLDEVAEQLLRMVAEYKPTRLFIDTFDDMADLALPRERLNEFWVAIFNYLRLHKVTTLGTMEFNQIVGTNLVVPENNITVQADTILFLRNMEIDGTVRRAISVIKMRDSTYDSRVFEFKIAESSGLEVTQPYNNQRTFLNGSS